VAVLAAHAQEAFLKPTALQAGLELLLDVLRKRSPGLGAQLAERRIVLLDEKDGTGFNVEVHSFPLDGRIVLFAADSEARDEEPAEAPPPPAPGRNGNPRRR